MPAIMIPIARRLRKCPSHSKPIVEPHSENSSPKMTTTAMSRGLPTPEQAVAQRRHEHPEKACSGDEAELLEELRDQQPDVHGRSLAAFAASGVVTDRGLRYRRRDASPTPVAAFCLVL